MLNKKYFRNYLRNVSTFLNIMYRQMYEPENMRSGKKSIELKKFPFIRNKGRLPVTK